MNRLLACLAAATSLLWIDARAETPSQPVTYLPVLLICPAETSGHPEQCTTENARVVYPGEQSTPSVMACAMATMGVVAPTAVGQLGKGEWVKIVCRMPMPVHGARNVG